MLGLLALPSESLFLVAANAASAAGFLLGRFFVEGLLIGVRLVDVRIGLLEQLVVRGRGLSGVEMNFNFSPDRSSTFKIVSLAPIRMMSPYTVTAGAHAHVFKLATLPQALVVYG